MMRHRTSSQANNNNDNVDESSDEEDAFSALSRKRKGEAKSKDTTLKKSAVNDRTEAADSTTNVDTQIEKVVVAQTSSTKRHHGEVSDARKAKLDAILLELEADTSKLASDTTATHNRNRRNNNNNSNTNNSSNHTYHRSIDDSEQYHHRTGGSFVDPGDELITTNIFVGNLASSITEEQMTELFRQFGENYFDLTFHSFLW